MDPDTNPIERRIAERLVDDILKAGHTISVYDGEETTLSKSSDRAAILGAMGTTCFDWLNVFDGDRRVGGIMLVWGNGADVISDYSWPSAGDETEIEALQKGASDLAEIPWTTLFLRCIDLENAARAYRKAETTSAFPDIVKARALELDALLESK